MATKVLDVITVGSATVDVFAQTESELISIQSATHTESLLALPVGGKVIIENLIYTVGGGGTNTAVGFSRLGHKTGYIGVLSTDNSDANSNHIETCLKNEKVSFLGHTSKAKTGYSIILNALNHDRTILTYKGANNDLTFAKLNKSKIQAKTFYFSSMVGKAFDAEVKLAMHAKKIGAQVAFNPSSYHVKEGFAYLEKMLKNTDILIFNKEESETLCQSTDRKIITEKLHACGITIIIITDGAKEIFASVQNSKSSNAKNTSSTKNTTKQIAKLQIKSNYEQYIATPSKKKCVESTGAGDAFACGFVSEYIKNKNIIQSLKVGMHNSESVISYYGAKEKLLNSKEIQVQLKKANFAIKRV
jgi:ribokinase